MKQRIYLIGMPGSGKSFFGKKLTEHLNCFFVDLDKEIEAKEKRTISDIFAAEGEAYFRAIEAELLRSLTSQHERMILSTGGGTPCFHDAMEYMNEHGITILLETARDVLVERLSKKSHRPLMRGDVEKTVDDLLKKRMNYYQQAHICIDHRDPDLLIELIKKI